MTDLCRRFAQYHDPKAGESASQFVRSSEVLNLNPSAALESVQLILAEKPNKLSSAQDTIISELARYVVDVRLYFVQRLAQSTTEFFEDMFTRGDASANCLRSIVLEMKLWQNEELRLRVEDDLFVLFIAKLMESGHDYDGRALKGITLLLMADTQRLFTHIDEDAFDALLSSLDFRLPADVRGQATLVITKFMEFSELEAQKYFVNFIKGRVSRQKANDLVVSFSAAAQLFPVAGNLAAQLFLTPGFLPSLMPLLDQQFSDPLVHDSFLALINAACVDGSCRKAIQDSCATWLSDKVSNGQGRQPAMAATVLAKLRTAHAVSRGGADPRTSLKTGHQDDVSDLVDLFQKSLLVESDTPPTPIEEKNISDSIEGLAYTSLRPEVKEQLASDPKILKALLKALEDYPASPEIVIGGLSIISNLTHYQPNLSEEQKKISQLKAYANASKPIDVSELEDDAHVQKRNAALVKAGVTATLTKISKSQQSSTATSQLTDTILNSLSRNKSDRGTIAQQGAVRLLIAHYQQQQQQTQSQSPVTKSPSQISPPPTLRDRNPSNAAHALARILISLNPNHVFSASGTPNITSAIPPLVSLLRPGGESQSHTLTPDTPRDLLPTFESLLALTNLASTSTTDPNFTVATQIIRSAYDQIEDLLLSHNDLLRRAAVELICNLVASPSGVAKYADGSPRARERLRILFAMADVEDAKTRLAAGGALAMLTDFDEVTSTISNDTERLPRTVEIVVDMIADQDTGLKHRGLVVLLNLLSAEHEGDGEKVKKVVLSTTGVLDSVKAALRDVRDQNILQLGVDVLKILMDRK